MGIGVGVDDGVPTIEAAAEATSREAVEALSRAKY